MSEISSVERVRDNVIEISIHEDATDKGGRYYLAYFSDKEARQLIEQLKEVVGNALPFKVRKVRFQQPDKEWVTRVYVDAYEGNVGATVLSLSESEAEALAAKLKEMGEKK